VCIRTATTTTKFSSIEERKQRYNNSLTREDYRPEYFLNEAPNLHKISSTIAQ
jgi:hypothetical protein